MCLFIYKHVLRLALYLNKQKLHSAKNTQKNTKPNVMRLQYLIYNVVASGADLVHHL